MSKNTTIPSEVHNFFSEKRRHTVMNPTSVSRIAGKYTSVTPSPNLSICQNVKRRASRMLSFAPKEEFVRKTGLLGRFAKYTLAE